MARDVLVLGGYGNFGKRIVEALARQRLPTIIAGRRREKADALAAELRRHHPEAILRAVDLDAGGNLGPTLARLAPGVVVDTCGPFQRRDYATAQACIGAGVHYVDLADGRDFVTGIAALDAKARAAGVWAFSGASTVPALTAAVIEQYREEFSRIDEIVCGIAPGQKTERGLATTEGVLTYVGRALKRVPGDSRLRYGWQDLYRQNYPEIGGRWMANVDVPDLDLLPTHYDIGQVRFSAGMELPVLHLGLWLLGWLVRLGVPLRLERHAGFFLRASGWLDRFGTPDGGMHIILSGKGKAGLPHERRWFLIAREGDGPQIPCAPAVILARRLASGSLSGGGARPCLGLVPLADYLEELRPYAIRTYAD